MVDPRPLRAACAALALIVGSLAGPAIAQAPKPTPAPAVTPEAQGTAAAVLTVLEAVCRPSTEANVLPEVSATRLGYPSVELPPNLPTGRPLHAWLAPGPGPGKIYLLDGGLPSSVQAGCILAVYGEALPQLGGQVQAQLAKDATGFSPNPTIAVAGPRQTVARFDRRRGDVVTSILVLQPAKPVADAPTAVIAVSRVDYGWMNKFGG